jgi:hypothetical protein
MYGCIFKVALCGDIYVRLRLGCSVFRVVIHPFDEYYGKCRRLFLKEIGFLQFLIS